MRRQAGFRIPCRGGQPGIGNFGVNLRLTRAQHACNALRLARVILLENIQPEKRFRASGISIHDTHPPDFSAFLDHVDCAVIRKIGHSQPGDVRQCNCVVERYRERSARVD